MSQIPAKADWHSEPLCLDGEHAYRNFFGKSRSEAAGLFKENALYYQEDLMFMPARCLSFYIEAYIDYLHSSASRHDGGGASCFFMLVQFRHAEIREFSPATVERIRHVLRHMATHQSWYDADDLFYGDFSERAEAELKRLEQ